MHRSVSINTLSLTSGDLAAHADAATYIGARLERAGLSA
jgi:hypothetical protein